MYKISVIIPVGSGRMGNLKNTLHALELQSCTDFEVILVNDGSGDPIHEFTKSKLDIKYVLTKKYQRLPIFDEQYTSENPVPPRNRGAMLASGTHYLFLDSDVIVNKDVVELFYEDIRENPHRSVMGLYDWLPPCRITPQLVKDGLDAIYEYIPYVNKDGKDDVDVKLKIPKLPYPEGGQTHNVCRDQRYVMFQESNPSDVFYGPGNMNCYLGMFSGLSLSWRDTFWKSGGYWNTLTAGIVDDGSFGLTHWIMSTERDADRNIVLKDGQPILVDGFGVSFDKRIHGAHQYHPRNVKFVQETSAREVDYINQMFGLEQYNDGRLPLIPKSVQELTKDVNKYWQVDKW